MTVIDAPTTKTEADLTRMRVLLHLIEHAPLLAIEYAATLPRYTSLVPAVAAYSPRFAADMPAENFLRELIEEAHAWLRQV